MSRIAAWYALPVSDNSWSEAGERSYNTGLSGIASRSTVRNCPFQSVTVCFSALAPRGCLAVRQLISRDSGVTHQLPCLSCRRRDKRHTTAVRRNHSLPHACWATAQRQAPQPAARGDIATLFASFASEKRGEWTYVLDPSGERRKARESKRERPVTTPL